MLTLLLGFVGILGFVMGSALLIVTWDMAPEANEHISQASSDYWGSDGSREYLVVPPREGLYGIEPADKHPRHEEDHRPPALGHVVVVH